MRSVLDHFTRQSVTLQRIGPRDFYGDITYQDPVQIRARYVEKQQLVTNAQGQEAISTATVLTSEEVGLGDLIEGRSVQARDSLVNFDGTVIGWRGYL